MQQSTWHTPHRKNTNSECHAHSSDVAVGQLAAAHIAAASVRHICRGQTDTEKRAAQAHTPSDAALLCVGPRCRREVALGVKKGDAPNAASPQLIGCSRRARRCTTAAGTKISSGASARIRIRRTLSLQFGNRYREIQTPAHRLRHRSLRCLLKKVASQAHPHSRLAASPRKRLGLGWRLC